MHLDPLVLKSCSAVILFGAICIPLSWILKRRVKIDFSIAISILVTAPIVILSVYELSIQRYISECLQLARMFPPEIISLPLLLLVIGLIAAFSLSKYMSMQTYRSIFHITAGCFFLLFYLIDANLGFLAICFSLTLFCFGEYLRRMVEDTPLTRFAKKILNPALREGEFEGYLASIFFLTGILIVTLTLSYEFLVASLAVLTFSDPSATLVGKRIGRHKWPHNPRKSVEGSIAMFIVATYVCIGLAAAGYRISPITALAVAAAISVFETLPLRIGDNLIIPVLAGMVLESRVGEMIGVDVNLWITVVPLMVALGYLAYRAGILDLFGVGVAIFFGLLIFHSSPLYLICLVLFMTVGYGFTKYKQSYKETIGIVSNNGRRGVNPVIANGIIPTFMAVSNNVFLFIGSLSAALADTLATEIGSLSRKAYLITNGAMVSPGTRGAVSALGYVASVFGSLIVLSMFILLSPVFGLNLEISRMAIVATVGGMVGCSVDSFLGASMKFLSKDEVNLLGTLAGCGVAFILP